jgi:hypothetical protein
MPCPVCNEPKKGKRLAMPVDFNPHLDRDEKPIHLDGGVQKLSPFTAKKSSLQLSATRVDVCRQRRGGLVRDPKLEENHERVARESKLTALDFFAGCGETRRPKSERDAITGVNTRFA